jgi:FkbM family methyltransferase
MVGTFRRIAGRIKRHLTSPPPPAAVTLAKMFAGEPAVIVQVGSNDGLQGDPIADLIRENPVWRVLFIEPLPHIFRRLMANYPQLPNYSFENVAISWERGMRRMYYVCDEIRKVRPDVPFWYDQLGSFDCNHVLKHGHDFEPFITSEEVRCEPLADTLARNGITGIDLLHVDTEGYDFEVIKQLDLTQQTPTAILYEHIHLSKIDKIALEKLLRDAGYRIQGLFTDSLALKS